MSKTWISVLVVGVVVIGWYLALSGNKGENSSRNNTIEIEEEVMEQTGDTKKMAFSDFVKQGGSYKCEVSQYLSDMENSGTVYINAGNIAGEFKTVAEGRNIDSSFILKDGYSYTWTSMLPNMGFKVKVDTDTTTGDGNANMSGTYSWNAEQIGDYNCEAWTADSSKFNLPSGVTFTEVGA